MFKKLEIAVGIATIIGVIIAAIALIPAFGEWLSPREPSATVEKPTAISELTNTPIPTTETPTDTAISLTEIPIPETMPPTAIPVPPTATPVPPTSVPSTPTPRSDTLPNGEKVSSESLARVIGGDPAYWTQRGPIIWGYWDKGHNVTFHHPGGNTILTYWAGFPEPRNANGCSIVIPEADNTTRYVKCPSGTQAEFEADGVGFHLVDYTGFFP